MPAVVTIIPKLSRIQTPSLCFNGILRRIIIGIGSTVTSKSTTQLTIPAASVLDPSLMQTPRLGNSQYE
jgi:hypothetical protein